MSLFLPSTAIIMKSNTQSLCLSSCLRGFYCGNPWHSVFLWEHPLNGLMWWACSYLLSDFTIKTIWYSFCHPQFLFSNHVNYTRLFRLLFKYCCTLAVHAHKDIQKLCNLLFCVGHQGLWRSVKAPFKLGSFWVALTFGLKVWEKRFLGRPSKVSFCWFCTSRKLGGGGTSLMFTVMPKYHRPDTV